MMKHILALINSIILLAHTPLQASSCGIIPSGPTGPTGPTGATGYTGSTGNTGDVDTRFSDFISAYSNSEYVYYYDYDYVFFLNFLQKTPQIIPFPFVYGSSGITLTNDTDFTIAKDGYYLLGWSYSCLLGEAYTPLVNNAPLENSSLDPIPLQFAPTPSSPALVLTTYCTSTYSSVITPDTAQTTTISFIDFYGPGNGGITTISGQGMVYLKAGEIVNFVALVNDYKPLTDQILLIDSRYIYIVEVPTGSN